MLWRMKHVGISLVTAVVFSLAMAVPIIAGAYGKPRAVDLETAAPISRAAANKLLARVGD
jgi:hypothetical protein